MSQYKHIAIQNNSILRLFEVIVPSFGIDCTACDMLYTEQIEVTR